MASAETLAKTTEPQEALREWLDRLNALVEQVKTWAEAWDWSTRRITKRMEDHEVGAYDAPALVMQEGFARVMLEPISRVAVGADGVVDLYRMPAYDDIASLFYHQGRWMMDFRWPGTRPTREDDAIPLNEEAFRGAIDAMRRADAERS